MSDGETPLVVTPAWLAAEGGAGSGVRVLDGSWHLPTMARDPAAEFLEAHIPGAAFFDIDSICDPDSSLPHMLPSPALFARSVSALGIGNNSHVVVYDTVGLYSAARVWWMFRVFGHERVSILAGGLPRWRAEGHPVESGTATIAPGFVQGDGPRRHAGPLVRAGPRHLRHGQCADRGCARRRALLGRGSGAQARSPAWPYSRQPERAFQRRPRR